MTLDMAAPLGLDVTVHIIDGACVFDVSCTYCGDQLMWDRPLGERDATLSDPQRVPVCDSCFP